MTLILSYSLLGSTMAFVSRFGTLLKQAGSKHPNAGSSSSNSSLFQTIRSMSSSKLFIGGLSYSTDEHGLRQAFDQYGQVTEAKVIMDRETGRSRGFGFVGFTSSEEANNALQDMNGKELHGRRLRVDFATERPPRPAYNNYGGDNYGSGNYGGGNYGGAGGGYVSGNFGGSGTGVGGYGGGDTGGNYNSPPSFDSFSSGAGGNMGPSFGGGDEQLGGFQGSAGGGNEDVVEGKFGDDNDEPDGYANTRG